ncbi:early light-induced protein 1, chloroplastic-like [Nymphaea colorata]|nr:early light-induced protein 1, chloroplastic-like [Nymphaea colorata]
MATSAALRSLVAPSRPLIGGTARLHATRLPYQRRNAFSVKSSIEDGPKEQQAPVTAPTPAPPKSSPATPKVSTKFSDVLAFGGPAPERINGRLAMVGFVAAMAVELTKGDDLASQLGSGGLWWFAGATALLSLASLVPMFKGVSAQARSGGVMTSDAELWNGRIAMLGLVALVFTEYLKGGALV